jgi:porin
MFQVLEFGADHVTMAKHGSRWIRRAIVIGTVWVAAGCDLAMAQSTAPDPNAPDFFTGIMRRDMLLGDMGGLRSLLGQYGVTLKLTDTTDVLGNVAGGIQKGATYNAATTLTLALDTQKAFGWDGGTLNVSGLQLRGRSLSQYYVGNLQTVSGISATPTTRLWEFWYQQSFADVDVDVRVGQQSIDQEFMVSAGSALYLNTVMGWPMIPSANLFAGGPAFPLSSLGIRLRAQPTGEITVLGGVFQDNPPGGPFNDDSQLRGSTRWGGNTNLRTGALIIGEVQYAHNQPANGDLDDGTKPDGLPGTYKLGFWFDTAGFPNQRYDTLGLSLADPATNGIARTNRTNFSLYGLLDQMIWRPAADSPRSLNVFLRAMGSPGDRNLISFSVNGGLNLKAPLTGRDDDTLGIGFGIAKVSSGAAGLDRDTAFYSGAYYPVRSTETFIELTYQAQVTPWLQIQPDLQYFHQVGGGVLNPTNPDRKIKDSVVIGVRTMITF